MKNTIVILFCFLILGVSMVISSMLLSNSMKNLTDKINVMNRPVEINQTDDTLKEYMPIGEVSSQLGYDDITAFTYDVIEGKFGDLPYINISGTLVFSRTAYEAWLVNSAKSNKWIK